MILWATALAISPRPDPCTGVREKLETMILASEKGEQGDDELLVATIAEAAAKTCYAELAQLHQVAGRLAPEQAEGLAALDQCISVWLEMSQERSSAHCWIDRARLLGPGEAADTALSKAQALGVDNFSLGWARGDLLWAEGRSEQALEAFRGALEGVDHETAVPYLYELAWRSYAEESSTPDTRYDVLATLDRVVAPETPPPDRATLQAALEPNEALVVILVGPTREGRQRPSWAGVLTPTDVRVKKVDGELVRSVEDFTAALRGKGDAGELGTRLHQILLGGLPDLPPVVTVLLDPVLTEMPFTALIGRDGKPLGASHAIAAQPTLSRWLQDRKSVEAEVVLTEMWEGQDMLGAAYREALKQGASHGEAMQHAIHTAIDGSAPTADWARIRLDGDGSIRPKPPSGGMPWRLIIGGVIGAFTLLGVLWTSRKSGQP